ncbi:transposase family protein [Ketobacter sp. MCCC 1A13808]|uniref:transposase family protein n=1 Tax=Ketobacter sp. MCCC 1A13808 TaxID=2602738 RepID=UPI0012EC7B38|nr:transposase family protein [Ketobacter sp. MCCC 1A13808]
MSYKKLIEYFSIIRDYRQSGKVDPKLTGIVLLVVYAVICGTADWGDISDFERGRLESLI